ncbi:gb [Venturia nashicola]|uniref:Gb n=1 Tax=Venturia nashicola TaxID=86259 RepID=A0A4Z1PC56_9PEZI|nr:gb [Venturia nashicola]TLD38850.1 gb [Venturia nashicola]
MRLEAAIYSSLLVSGRFCEATAFDVGHGLHRRHADFRYRMRRDADSVLHQREKRNDVFGAENGAWPTVVVPPGFTLAAGVQITPIPGATNTFVNVPTGTAIVAASQQSTNSATMDSTKWNEQAEQACMTAVMNLRGKSSNPAGLAVCYNVPYLDEVKGTFEAELRMYNVSTPSEEFVGVTPAMMLVTLQYQGATIQTSNGALPVKRDLIELVERQVQADNNVATPTGTAMPPSGAMPQGIMMPSEVAVRKYIGVVNKALLVPGMNLSTFQPLLIPQIAISATSPQTKLAINTSLSSTESSFVAGVFSKAAGNVTDPKELLGNPQEQLAAAEAGLPTPFAVPGLSLAVFPVGLIVTGTWMFFFVTAVGLGTLGRMQFRDQYRRAIRAQKEETQRRI